jgi:hypothetical protein
MSVHVGEAGAVRLHGEYREAACPTDHPRHRNAGEERALGSRGQLTRTRMLTFEMLELARQEIVEGHRC